MWSLTILFLKYHLCTEYIMELYQQQLNIVWKSVFKDEIEVSIHNCVTQAI